METLPIEKQPKISLIVAVAKNGVIGNGRDLIFRISDDLKRFKALTLGHPIIMGRKTYESIGKPLPGRTNIITTRNRDYSAPGCLIASSLEEALEKARELGSKIFVIGGGEIYKQALPYADRLYLTLVESDAEGNVFFPEWREKFKKETFREERFDEKTGLKYVWLDLERE